MADNLNEQAPATVETSDRGWFDFMKTKKEEEKPQEDTLVSEFDHKAQVSEPDFKKEEFEDEKNKHVGLLEKLHRSDSSSSSSSDEEGNDEEKKQRRKEKNEKKGLKQKLDEKLHGHKAEDDTNVPIEKYEETEKLPHVQPAVYAESPLVQESDHKKAGFLDKVKDKLPSSHNKADEHHVSAAPVETEKLPHVQEAVYSEPPLDHEKKAGFLDKVKDKLPGGHNKADEHHVSADTSLEAEGKDKKGFLDKIKDKIPGLHSKTPEEKKEHEEKKKGF
ncbi:hypothetical protein RND81_02G061500 [Saponaria officinalis]|uniref:Dehydrin n=1 Tax=Saponaria officinalis TaxID=3572 RepID=A0AAW1MN36_SAPOF